MLIDSSISQHQRAWWVPPAAATAAASFTLSGCPVSVSRRGGKAWQHQGGGAAAGQHQEQQSSSGGISRAATAAGRLQQRGDESGTAAGKRQQQSGGGSSSADTIIGREFQCSRCEDSGGALPVFQVCPLPLQAARQSPPWCAPRPATSTAAVWGSKQEGNWATWSPGQGCGAHSCRFYLLKARAACKLPAVRRL